MRTFATLLWVSAVGCPDSDVEWARFNATDDQVEVALTTSDTVGDPVSTELHSSTGAVVVGTGTVDPGSGPAGTRHTVQVDVADAYQETVGRVSVFVDAGARGREEFELERDSADIGYWQLEIESYGDAGESRTDTFAFRLWQVADGTLITDFDTGSDTDTDTDPGTDLGTDLGI